MRNKGEYRGVDYVTGRFVYGELSFALGDPMIEIPAGLVKLKDGTLEKYNEATKSYEKVTTWKS